MITARIETLIEKKLIGKRLTMSFTNNKTFDLWSSFMPHKKEILNTIDSELYSVEVYPDGYYERFNPNNEFEKWAAIEVTNFNTIPKNMETLIFPTGLYAVFLHKGKDSEAVRTYTEIFTKWFPISEYKVDNRPHFAVMGEKYKRDDSKSEEEIWIPIKLR